MTPPAIMCRQHLLGEHVELHMLIGTMRNGVSIAGYCETGLAEPRSIYSRHQALVDEMIVRGYNHRSPLDKSEVVGLVNKLPLDQAAAEVGRIASEFELTTRCDECAARKKAMT